MWPSCDDSVKYYTIEMGTYSFQSKDGCVAFFWKLLKKIYKSAIKFVHDALMYTL